jgi:hypothetical protein
MMAKAGRIEQKKKRKGKGARISPPLRCRTCDIKFDNYTNYRRHMQSPKHRHMRDLVEAGQMPSVSIREGRASAGGGGGGGLLVLLLLGLIVGSFVYYTHKKD